jgi:putative ABC transport system permease protein
VTAGRAYRMLLRLGPRALVRRHGAEMEHLFLEALDDARRRGGLAAARVWAAATLDLLSASTRRIVRGRRSVPGPIEARKTSMFGSDLRYTLRWLGRQRSSTALVVAMLSLGIAANIVVFSLVNALFLRPFPVPDPSRLVYVNETAPKWNLDVVGVNYPDFHQWRQSAKLFDNMAIWDETAFNFSDGTNTDRLDGARVTHDWPAVLRIRPLLGRMFTAEEDRPGAPPVVVIGEGLWRDRFGGREDALGRTLKLNGVAHTIIGVMPKAASFPGDIRLWVPLAGNPTQTYQSYGYNGVLARLKDGVTTADAEKDLLRAQQPIWDARDRQRVVSPYVRSLRETFVRDFRAQARTLLAAVAILLIVACANVASVMLARAIVRRREMGIRLAIGASRGRLARQLFLENVLLAIVAGVVGVAVGRWALALLLDAAGDQVPRWADFSLDVRVAAFALVLSAATTIIFGLAPALHAIRGSVRGAMHDTTGGTTTGPGGRRLLKGLVGAEFALAAVLVVCGGLLFEAFDRIRRVDPGFNPDRVLTFSIALPEAIYGSENDELRAKAVPFWNRLVERLQALPGVESAGLVSCPPLGCHWGTFFVVEGGPPPVPGAAHPVTLYRPATAGYFPAMGIRLKSGRFFAPEDGKGENRVVIVNETFVKTFWPGVEDAVGRRMRGTDDTDPWMRIVGVVHDVRHYGLEEPMRPGVYMPLQQAPAASMAVAIRTTGDPAAFTATASAAVRELDPELPLYRVRTMEQAITRSLAQRTLYSWLLAVFAGIALALALGGTYGVTSYLVSQRTREIGIRVALGAQRRDIIRSVLAGSSVVVIVGAGIGVASAIATAPLMEELLFNVSVRDPRVLAAALMVLVATSISANWLPARRAAKVDPMRALRVE